MDFSKRLMERLRGWRTILLNAGMAISFALAEMMSYLQIVEWREVISATYAPWVVIGINLLNIVLRHITDRPAPTHEITQRLFGGGGS